VPLGQCPWIAAAPHRRASIRRPSFRRATSGGCRVRDADVGSVPGGCGRSAAVTWRTGAPQGPRQCRGSSPLSGEDCRSMTPGSIRHAVAPLVIAPSPTPAAVAGLCRLHTKSSPGSGLRSSSRDRVVQGVVQRAASIRRRTTIATRGDPPVESSASSRPMTRKALMRQRCRRSSSGHDALRAPAESGAQPPGRLPRRIRTIAQWQRVRDRSHGLVRPSSPPW